MREKQALAGRRRVTLKPDRLTSLGGIVQDPLPSP